MESIEGIKIIQVDGLNPSAAASANGDGGGAGAGNLAEQVVASALRYRAQAPLLDSLMRDVGLSGGDLAGLVGHKAGNGDNAAREKKLDELLARNADRNKE
jgi:uncharacterized membrane protein YqiK